MKALRQETRALVTIALILLVLVLMGCTVERPTPTKEAQTSAPQSEATQSLEKATAAFRVEISASETPTLVDDEGTPLPSNTPGPTNTPKPTRTPWPTIAPTSAPVDDPSMVYVEGGEFIFGSDSGNQDETPQQIAYLDGFNIDIYPVTNAQYAEFVESTGHRAPRNWKEGAIPAGKENHPVVWVTWEDAAAYADWAGKRLPTEMEWEKAARGVEGLLFTWGNTFDANLCNSRDSEIKDTSPVGAYPDGASPYGAQDMCGNVWEWTSDWYQAYRGSLYSMDRYGEVNKVIRGGSWFDGSDVVLTTTRNSAKPTFMFSTIGFRCVE